MEKQYIKIAKPKLIPSKDQLKERIKGIIALYQKSNYAAKRAILQTFIKKMTLDPLSTWTQIDKENKKASDCLYDLHQVEVFL